jgi:hypothetical protein
MGDTKKFSLVKPTADTPFHIDFDWWKQHDNNWRVHLQSCLCPEHQAIYTETSDAQFIDWIDPNTAEVHSVDGLQHVLMTHCAIQPEFLTGYTTLVDSTFRVFLANGNSPLTPKEIAEKIDKPADTILRTLSGPKVYKGIRPCQA